MTKNKGWIVNETAKKIRSDRTSEYRYKLKNAIILAIEATGSASAELHVDLAFKVDRKKIQVEVLKDLANILERDL